MGFIDELKRLARPYEDEEDEEEILPLKRESVLDYLDEEEE